MTADPISGQWTIDTGRCRDSLAPCDKAAPSPVMGIVLLGLWYTLQIGVNRCGSGAGWEMSEVEAEHGSLEAESRGES